MADKTFPVLDGSSKKLKDMGDGTFAEIVAFTADSPVQLTGTVVVDTLGALNNTKVVDPDAASATLPALARGQLAELVLILAKLSADPSTETTLASLLTSIGAPSDAKWNGTDASASLIAIAKKIAAP